VELKCTTKLRQANKNLERHLDRQFTHTLLRSGGADASSFSPVLTAGEGTSGFCLGKLALACSCNLSASKGGCWNDGVYSVVSQEVVPASV